MIEAFDDTENALFEGHDRFPFLRLPVDAGSGMLEKRTLNHPLTDMSDQAALKDITGPTPTTSSSIRPLFDWWACRRGVGLCFFILLNSEAK